MEGCRFSPENRGRPRQAVTDPVVEEVAFRSLDELGPLAADEGSQEPKDVCLLQETAILRHRVLADARDRSPLGEVAEVADLARGKLEKLAQRGDVADAEAVGSVADDLGLDQGSVARPILPPIRE